MGGIAHADDIVPGLQISFGSLFIVAGKRQEREAQCQRFLFTGGEEPRLAKGGEALVLPVKEDRVLVPTWVVYALAEDGCFDAIKR